MATPTTATSSGSSASLPFDTVLRGYERRQVDDYVTKQKDEIAKLQEELAEAQRKRRLANEHAEATERELREVRAKSAHSEPRSVEDSFGYRAEKLLRIAEQLGGLHRVSLQMTNPRLAHADLLRGIELLGTEVAPRVASA